MRTPNTTPPRSAQPREQGTNLEPPVVRGPDAQRQVRQLLERRGLHDREHCPVAAGRGSVEPGGVWMWRRSGGWVGTEERQSAFTYSRNNDNIDGAEERTVPGTAAGRRRCCWPPPYHSPPPAQGGSPGWSRRAWRGRPRSPRAGCFGVGLNWCVCAVCKNGRGRIGPSMSGSHPSITHSIARPYTST